MGLKRRMRTQANSREVLDRHNRHDGTTWPELMWEKEREEAARRAARARKQAERKVAA